MNNKVNEYSNEWLLQQKMVLEDAPRDDVDFALIMYLFRHSKPSSGCLYEEGNVITIGKIAKYFDLEYRDVEERLRRMTFWVSVYNVYHYIKPIVICEITEIGIRAVMKTMEIFEVEE